MSLAMADLRYVLLRGGKPPEAASALYEEAYRLWKAVWSETLLALDGNPTLYADDFTRQSYIGCLFHEKRCVALGFFHAVDFRFLVAKEDSYFKVWPLEALDKLTKNGPDVLVGSNITVDKALRGELENGMRLKNTLIGLMVKTFLDAGADAMTGTMRVDRNMSLAAQRFGAQPLMAGLVHHGVDVELVAFYRPALLQSGAVSNMGIESLWRKRVDYRDTRVARKRQNRGAKS